MRVISIIGWGRSGSTLLDRILGSVPGAFPTGELRYFFERLARGGTCGCGARLHECEVWSAVLASDRLASFDPEATMTLLNRFARVRHTGSLLRKDPESAAQTPGLAELVDRVADVYAAIGDVTGTDLIVDSSKFPSHGALLRLLPDVEPCFVQLVRDPRAVAYSWSRSKPGLEGIPRCGSVFSSTKWVQWNLACERIERAVGPERYVTLRYEDFVAAPGASLDRILSVAGHEGVRDPAVSGHEAVLTTSHTINGNPDRFVTGAVPIKEDSRWLRSLPFAPWGISTTLTAPLLGRYGYRWRTGAPWQRGLQVG
jgi:hypothetical protein